MKSVKALMIGVLCLCYAVDAQELASFRSQSTGNLMCDDLDLMLDPLELGYTKGYRIYSNLSNLGSGQEEAIGSSSDNTLVLGIGGDLPFVNGAKGALFVIRRNASNALPVSLDLDDDGFAELSADGLIGGEYDHYFDGSGDGLYDFRIHREGLRENKQESSWRQMVATAIYDMDIWKLGLRLNASAEGESGSRRDNWEYRHYDLEPSFQTTAIESYDIETDDSEEKKLTLDVAMTKPWRQAELGFVLSLGHWANTLNNDNVDQLYERDYNDQEDLTYDDSNEDNGSQGNEFKRTGFGMEFRYRRQLKENADRRQEDFWELRSEFRHWGGAEKDFTEDISEELTLNGSTRQREWASSSDNYDGDFGVTRIGLSGRWVKNLDDQVRVAFGVSISRELWKVEQEGVSSLSVRDSSVYNDGVWDYYDTWTHSSRHQTYDLNDETKIDELRIPVALEYVYGKKRNWTFRLSASYGALKEVVDDLKQIKSADPYIQEFHHGDGSYSVTIDDVDYTSYKHHEVKKTNNTEFAYGLGYAPTPSLQVDFMSFFGSEDNSLLDASFYRNLRLSATFRF